LTGRPAKTLLLARPPRVSACLAALLLAVLLHPLGMQLSTWIQYVYPVQGDTKETIGIIERMMQTAPNWWLPLLLMAVLPAICEELTFRGFVLSGLRHLGNKWWAIGLTAVFFGMVHGFVQQSIAAATLGM